jgi:hypothetical protein
MKYDFIDEKTRLNWEKAIKDNPKLHENSSILGAYTYEVTTLTKETEVIENIEIIRSYPYSEIKFKKNKTILAFIILNALINSISTDEKDFEIYLNNQEIENVETGEIVSHKNLIKNENIITLAHTSENSYKMFRYCNIELLKNI